MVPSGQEVTRGQTQNGVEALIRYPQWEDVEIFTAYVNRLAREDTYVSFSGVEFTPQEEVKHMTRWFNAMTTGDAVILTGWVHGNLAGVVDIERNKKAQTRGYHVADFGISVDQAYRGQGIGRQLAQAAIYEAQCRIDGLRLITLTVYATNIAGRRLYTSLGFIEYGRLPGGILHRGEYVDEIYMYLPCTA